MAASKPKPSWYLKLLKGGSNNGLHKKIVKRRAEGGETENESQHKLTTQNAALLTSSSPTTTTTTGLVSDGKDTADLILGCFVALIIMISILCFIVASISVPPPIYSFPDKKEETSTTHDEE
eukprot:GHVS01100748.1.p1 GENE.GHVS01100748.1~~GHVS01100748.1.p1  ORF type:complete len:122 (+),score=34.05 GHVS01100748.1:473-838(+)